MRSVHIAAWWSLLLLGFTACNTGSDEGKPVLDRFNIGTIHISCDETFKPVIDAQVKVYESQFPDTRIIVHYKSEAECFRDLLVDSIRMVIATRNISEEEK